MSESATQTTSEAGLRAEIRLLAMLLVIFAAIKLVACSLIYFAALAGASADDRDTARTLYWLPQILFYTLLAASSLRLRRFEMRSRSAVVGLSVLSLVATVLYTALDFTIGPGREQPAMAVAIKLRLLASGDAWDIVFPVLALVWLWPAETRRLFEDR